MVPQLFFIHFDKIDDEYLKSILGVVVIIKISIAVHVMVWCLPPNRWEAKTWKDDHLVHGHTLQWHHNECNDISNHQHLDYLFDPLFRCRSPKTLKLCITGLCEGNSPVKFPTQRASNAENISIRWHHHDMRHVHGIRLQCVKMAF